LLRLGDLNFAVGQFLVNLLLDSITIELSLSFTSHSFVINYEAGAHLECVKVTNQVLATVQFLLVRVGQALDGFLALFFTLKLVGLILDNLVFLALHPLDVHNLLTLFLEVIATLPVSLALFVLFTVKGCKLLINGLNLFADLVS